MSKPTHDFAARLLRSASLDRAPPDGAQQLMTRLVEAGVSEQDALARRGRPWWTIGLPLAMGAGLVASASGVNGPLRVDPPAIITPIATPIAAPVENVTPVLSIDDLPAAVSVDRPAARATGRAIATTPRSGAAAPAPAASDDESKVLRPIASGSDLKAEVAALDAVRAALRAGDTSRALRFLEAYEVRFPTGLLRPEASVLRIETHAASGDTVSARGVGEAFLAAFPTDSHAARVRRLLEGLPR